MSEFDKINAVIADATARLGCQSIEAQREHNLWTAIFEDAGALSLAWDPRLGLLQSSVYIGDAAKIDEGHKDLLLEYNGDFLTTGGLRFGVEQDNALTLTFSCPVFDLDADAMARRLQNLVDIADEWRDALDLAAPVGPSDNPALQDGVLRA